MQKLFDILRHIFRKKKLTWEQKLKIIQELRAEHEGGW